MNKIILFLFLVLDVCFSMAVADGCAASESRQTDGFSGPFASWRNVKTYYGAVGDGIADDTLPIQKGLDDLRLHKDFCVLYVPTGIYRVTKTLTTSRNAHFEYMGVSVIGEDPSNTVIRWDGKPGEIMLQYSVWYSKIGRLTLDGAGKAGICLAYGPGFSTYNETSDMVFKDAATGLLLGVGEQGQAENAVLRCQFIRCHEHGVCTTNFNSLNIWVWNSRFEDCGYGMANGAGNFHAYQNFFVRSKKADIKTDNLMIFSFVDNVSVGSACFIDFSGGHSWGSPTSITGNRIVSEAQASSIRLGNGGPYLVADNVIKGNNNYSGPQLELTWGDQVLIGNVYTSKEPIKYARGGRVLSIDDGVMPLDEKEDFLVEAPSSPRINNRKVFEVPVGADTRMIQRTIDYAAKFSEGLAVVHFAKGIYKINHTLIVPPNSQIQLIGDGAAETATVLEWEGEPLGLVLRFTGPSRAVIKDLMIKAGGANGIVVDNADQSGGQICVNQLIVSGQSGTSKPAAGFLVKGIENSNVQIENFQGGVDTKEWIRVIGGEKLRAGLAVPGRISILCGATGSSERFYSVSRGARLISRSVYHELSNDDVSTVIALEDSGGLFLDATRFSCKTSITKPLVESNNFRGDFMMATSLLLPVKSQKTAWLNIKGNGSETRFLTLADLYWVYKRDDSEPDKLFVDRSSPAAETGMVLCGINFEDKAKPGDLYGILQNKGGGGDDFIREMTEPLRERRTRPAVKTPKNTTDFKISRVMCISGKSTVGVKICSEKNS